MPPRRAVAAAILVVCGLVTAGCSPPSIAITAVFLDGGHPTALFHPCGRTLVDGVAVSEWSAAFASVGAPSSSHAWYGRDVSGTGSGVTELRLLELPPSWVQQITKPGALLTSLVDGMTYWVVAKAGKPSKGNDVGVKFTLSDLRSLTEGQVWAVPRPDADATAMSRDEFRKRAADSC
jgi:hypothetical protein